jgi:hypothetical protein
MTKYDQNGRKVTEGGGLPTQSTFNQTMRNKFAARANSFARGSKVFEGPQNVEPKPPNRLFNKEIIQHMLIEKNA